MRTENPLEYVQQITNLKKNVDLTKQLWIDRIITKENAVECLWRSHTAARQAMMKNYIVRIIKAIETGVY